MTWFIRLVPVLMSEIASEVLLSWNEGGADGLPLPILPRTCLRLGDRTNIQILVMAGALAVKQPWDGVIDATATPKNLSPSATALIRNWWYATDDIKDDTE